MSGISGHKVFLLSCMCLLPLSEALASPSLLTLFQSHRQTSAVHSKRQKDQACAVNANYKNHRLEHGSESVYFVLIASMVVASASIAIRIFSKRRAVRSIDIPSVSDRDVMLGICYIANFFSGWLYTLIIPTSYQFVTSLGGSAAFSGLVIGGIKISSLAGVLLSSCAQYRHPGVMSRHPLDIILGVFCVHLLASVLYASMTVSSSTLLLQGILAARLLSGLAEGVSTVFIYNYVAQIVPRSERPMQYTILSACSMAGNGFGPICSSVSVMLVGHKFGNPTPPAVIACMFLAAYIAGAAILCPRATSGLVCQENIDDEEVGNETTSSIHSRGRLAMLMGGCLLVSTLRGYLASGLEAATAMILETERIFCWTNVSVGLAVGAVFLGVSPLTFLYKSLKLSEMTFLRIGACMTLLGTVFLHDSWCAHLSRPESCVKLLLGADTIAFGGLLFLGGLSDGIAAKHAGRGKGWLSLSSYITVRAVLVNTVARGLGPPAARHANEIGGRSLYATLQLATAVLAFAVVEIVIKPHLFNRDPKNINVNSWLLAFKRPELDHR